MAEEAEARARMFSVSHDATLTTRMQPLPVVAWAVPAMASKARAGNEECLHGRVLPVEFTSATEGDGVDNFVAFSANADGGKVSLSRRKNRFRHWY